MRMHVFPGRFVQRWSRTRRSSDPLQQRPRRLHFQPQGVVLHRELESGVGIRVRSRSAAAAAASAPFTTSSPRPCSACCKRQARQAGYVQIVALMPSNAVGHRQKARIMVGNASLQVSAPFCSMLLLSRLRCSACCSPIARAGCSRRCGLCVSVLFLATVPAPSMSVRSSDGCASSCSASAFLPRARSSKQLLRGSPAARRAAASLAPWARRC